MHRLHKTSQLIYVEWLTTWNGCVVWIYFIFPFYYVANGIECSSELMQRAFYELSFYSAICANKVKIHLDLWQNKTIVSCFGVWCARANETANYGHTCDFSPCFCVHVCVECIHELDRPSSFSCWIKAKSLVYAHSHKLHRLNARYIHRCLRLPVLREQIVLALLHTIQNKAVYLIARQQHIYQIDASQHIKYEIEFDTFASKIIRLDQTRYYDACEFYYTTYEKKWYIQDKSSVQTKSKEAK